MNYDKINDGFYPGIMSWEHEAKNDYPSFELIRIGIAKGCVRSLYLN